MKKLSTLVAEVLKPLDQIREKIAANRQRHHELKRAPLTREESATQFRGWLDYQSELCRAHLGEVLRWFTHPGAVPELFPPEMTPNAVARTAGPVIAALNRPALEAFATEFFESANFGDLSRDSIRDDLTKLDAELLKLEIREESLIREFEEQGLPVSRRGDASPRVVLAENLEELS